MRTKPELTLHPYTALRMHIFHFQNLKLKFVLKVEPRLVAYTHAHFTHDGHVCNSTCVNLVTPNSIETPTSRCAIIIRGHICACVYTSDWLGFLRHAEGFAPCA